MKSDSLHIHLFISFFILISVLSGQPCNAENAVMLTIRSDRLPSIEVNSVGQKVESRKRDPFYWPAEVLANYAPSKTTDSAQLFAGLTLESIMHDGDNSIAIINGKILSLGDFISGAKIVAIEKNTVTLGKGGTTHTITLGKKFFSFKTSKTIETF